MELKVIKVKTTHNTQTPNLQHQHCPCREVVARQVEKYFSENTVLNELCRVMSYYTLLYPTGILFVYYLFAVTADFCLWGDA